MITIEDIRLCYLVLWSGIIGAYVKKKPTPTIPISVCYYLESHNAIASYLGVQILLIKVQYVVWTL